MRNALLRDYVRSHRDPVWYEIFNQMDAKRGKQSRAMWIKDILKKVLKIKDCK
jgi:hypothetical protein